MRAAMVLSCAVLLSGCYQIDIVAERAACAGSECATDAGLSPDAGPGGFCEGGGPVISVGDGRCGGDLAQRAFRFAVCSCESLVSSAGITADSFDSRIAPYSTGGAGASVGINGRLDLNAPGRINGGLWLSDASGMVAGQSGSLDISRSLSCAGPVQSQAALNVGQDARINGNLRAQSLSVGGRLTMPEGAVLDVVDSARWGERRAEAVPVAPPCDCAPDALVDIGALVSARENDNDNVLMGVAQDDLRGASGRHSFECGRYYLRGVQADAGLNLHINGRVALFVQGDVSVGGRLTITLGPQAELDLLISGQLNTGEPPLIGSLQRPAQARTYVGGRGTVQLTGGGQFAGSLYAPRSELVSSGPIEVFGALFARRIVTSGRLTLHYDRALQAAADDCPPRTDLTCSTCADCRSSACIDGQCQPCVRDSDCCTPLTCQQGACLIEP